MQKSIWITLLFSLFFFSCERGEKNPIEGEKAKVIQKIVEEIILPEEEQFFNNVEEFQKKITTFTQTPTSEQLAELRDLWISVAKEWARCYAFNIGKVKKGDFFRYFSTFPINTTSLEKRIKETQIENLNSKYVLNQFGLDLKGIYAIEYLLFKEGVEANLSLFQKDEKRKKVLDLIVKEFFSDVKNNRKEWNKFAPILIANKEPIDSKNNSFTLIFGGLDNVIHYAWETKVGKAIRKKDIEAPYSKQSLSLVRENVAIAKKVYFDGGISTLVKRKMNGDEKLNKAVADRFTKIEKALDELNMPLVDIVKKENAKNLLDNLLSELKALEKIEFTHIETLFNLVDGTKEGDGD